MVLLRVLSACETNTNSNAVSDYLSLWLSKWWFVVRNFVTLTSPCGVMVCAPACKLEGGASFSYS